MLGSSTHHPRCGAATEFRQGLRQAPWLHLPHKQDLRTRLNFSGCHMHGNGLTSAIPSCTCGWPWSTWLWLIGWLLQKNRVDDGIPEWYGQCGFTTCGRLWSQLLWVSISKCMHLASFAGFTYWIRECLWIKLKSLHQVAWEQLLDACHVWVAEATMPDVPVQGEGGGRTEGGKFFNRNGVPVRMGYPMALESHRTQGDCRGRNKTVLKEI